MARKTLKVTVKFDLDLGEGQLAAMTGASKELDTLRESLDDMGAEDLSIESRVVNAKKEAESK